MTKAWIRINILGWMLLSTSILHGQSIVTTVHNLSASGPGTIKATTESEICIFCHTPHNSKPMSPLWNRNDPGTTYTLYNSSTINAVPGQPDGSSILCLSCHDGTIALGNVLSRTSDITFASGVTVMPSGPSRLTTDLSDDHPISFIYNSSLAAADGQLKDPVTITQPVTLENDKLQCVSCHDPHKNIYGDFLVVSNQFSTLCLKCHDLNYWGNSSHKNSTATWNNTGTNPWPRSSYTTVSENACENCHNPHTSGRKARIMNYLNEENNCLVCHNGNVASTDIESQLTKPYTHNVYAYNLIHDPVEPDVVNVQHVECEDCHNPHAVRQQSAVAPNANGFLEGVRGISSSGSEVNPIQYEYELCYRCHADSPVKPGSPTTRVIEQNNVRLEFDLSNPSFHPIEGPGKNTNVPSLILPYTESSVIYCTDCHASNGTSPAGPHGSDYPQILKYQYITADYTTESATNYELCYSCHSRSSILGNNSFRRHRTHIQGADTPCNVCHDPHGISSTQGNSTNNSHLINFDTDVVFPSNSGRLRFEDRGTFRGRCYLKCHGRNHDPKWY
ncbi:MAG: hypothetical protein GXO83_07740 [Chlorobi bacterium]|nr:hypothetical protein [Chlorobiota bacterium]